MAGSHRQTNTYNANANAHVHVFLRTDYANIHAQTRQTHARTHTLKKEEKKCEPRARLVLLNIPPIGNKPHSDSIAWYEIA